MTLAFGGLERRPIATSTQVVSLFGCNGRFLAPANHLQAPRGGRVRGSPQATAQRRVSVLDAPEHGATIGQAGPASAK